MNDAELNPVRELSWRRELTAAEAAELQRRLAADPRARAEWETEAALNQLLERLPEAPPVASNFTALVMQSFALDAAAQARDGANRSRDSWRGWHLLPRAALAALVAGFVIVGYEGHQVRARAALARNMAQVAEVVSASGQDFIQDLEPIRRMGGAQPQPDVELLALMKTR